MKIASSIFVVMILFFLGCSSTPRGEDLLRPVELPNMKDSELLRYDADLAAAIASADSGGSTSVGTGVGIGTYGSGVSVGILHRLGDSKRRQALLERRGLVREELSRRGLVPPTGSVKEVPSGEGS